MLPGRIHLVNCDGDSGVRYRFCLQFRRVLRCWEQYSGGLGFVEGITFLMMSFAQPFDALSAWRARA
jgi:hypothetical protein